MTFDPCLRTVTCVSTGGPATYVTWTRDDDVLTEGSETVLDNTLTAQYTHTLTVTTAGEYNCTVANAKLLLASSSKMLYLAMKIPFYSVYVCLCCLSLCVCSDVSLRHLVTSYVVVSCHVCLHTTNERFCSWIALR